MSKVSAKFGDPVLPPRFWTKVTRSRSGCWTWKAGKTGPGYGTYALTAREPRVAHRVAYEALVGPIPTGLVLDHLCRNRACVKPGHLEPVTQRENILRGTAPAARNAVATHCIRGHEFNAENTGTHPRGRFCRPCARQWSREYYKASRSRGTVSPGK